jgi:hypothetical protein
MRAKSLQVFVETAASKKTIGQSGGKTMEEQDLQNNFVKKFWFGRQLASKYVG